MTPPPEIRSFHSHFVPAAEPSRQLAVVLHGLGDSLEGFLWLPDALRIPTLNYLLLNAPNPYPIGYSWYDIENQEPGVLHGRALLRQLMGELEEQGWASTGILPFGFSQGCLMAIDFALRHEQPLAGVVGISGYAFLPKGAEAEFHSQAARQAWLITHGNYDPLLPLAKTRTQMERLRAAGIPIEWHEFPKEHTIDFEEELPLLRRWIAARFGEA